MNHFLLHLALVLTVTCSTAHAGSASFALPASEEGLPGEGELRRYDAYVQRWAEYREGWSKRIDQDRGAVVFLGDSITQGWGAEFRGLFPGMKLANRGIGGDTTRGMLIRLREDILALNPSAIVLLLGTNDIEVGIDPDAIGRNFVRILDAIRARDRRVPVILCRVFPSTPEKSRPRSLIEAINARYDAAVKSDPNVIVVDTWTLFADASGNANPAWFKDGLHLNTAGYERWADTLRPVLASLGPAAGGAGDLQMIHGDQRKAGAEATDPGRLAWYREAKFGMFIHWGLYSVPGGVWNGKPSRRPYAEHIQLSEKIPKAEYVKLANEFNPVKFDAAEWARLAREAGMRYVVMVAKHQDGFAMFDSKASDFNIVAGSPFGRDTAKELADAVRAEGLTMGFYYSHARDHHHPLANWNKHGNVWDFPPQSKENFIRYLNEKAKPQLRELLTGYGDLGVMWFDVPYDIPVEECADILALVRGLQPGCLVNSRLGGDVWDYQSLGDNQIADTPLLEPWETCMTFNHSWGYHQLDHDWKSAADIVRHLADIVSKGGNLLLNIGPKGDGSIPEETVTRLNEVGRWMARNGDSIHGASPTPIGQPDWGRCTAKGDRIFLHVFDWPADGILTVENLPRPVGRAALLDGGQALALSGDSTRLTIRVPAAAPDPANTVIVLTPR